MSKRITKTIFIVFLLFVSIATTLFSFYNLNNEKQISAMQINLKENEEFVVQRVLSHDPSKRLVPKNAILGVDDIDEVVLSYDITLSDSEELILDVKADNILIGNNTTYNHLVNIEFIKSNDQNKYKVEAILTLNMPANEVEYLGIVNQQITFTLIFSARK